MTVESDPAGDLTERVARWAAAGERYEVEFKSELRRPLNDRDLRSPAIGLPQVCDMLFCAGLPVRKC